jgi:hypothetical protein
MIILLYNLLSIGGSLIIFKWFKLRLFIQMSKTFYEPMYNKNHSEKIVISECGIRQVEAQFLMRKITT